MLRLAEAFINASRNAKEQNTAMLFFVDIDADTYWAERAIPAQEDGQEQKSAANPVKSALSLIKAKNSTKEAFNGKISFFLMPDGTKEFGMLLAADPATGNLHTIFINPYRTYPEVFEGEDCYDKYAIR